MKSGLLLEAGAICLLAATHDQAVTLARTESELALAILDFQMPDGDVGQLVERLRTAHTLLPLIGTSGTDRRDEFAERGLTQFLEKPWQLGDLVRCFDSTLPAPHAPGSMDVRTFPARLA
jgi:CheY-like chemotaxis protein